MEGRRCRLIVEGLLELRLFCSRRGLTRDFERFTIPRDDPECEVQNSRFIPERKAISRESAARVRFYKGS